MNITVSSEKLLRDLKACSLNISLKLVKLVPQERLSVSQVPKDKYIRVLSMET